MWNTYYSIIQIYHLGTPSIDGCLQKSTINANRWFNPWSTNNKEKNVLFDRHTE